MQSERGESGCICLTLNEMSKIFASFDGYDSTCWFYISNAMTWDEYRYSFIVTVVGQVRRRISDILRVMFGEIIYFTFWTSSSRYGFDSITSIKHLAGRSFLAWSRHLIGRHSIRCLTFFTDQKWIFCLSNVCKTRQWLLNLQTTRETTGAPWCAKVLRILTQKLPGCKPARCI